MEGRGYVAFNRADILSFFALALEKERLLTLRLTEFYPIYLRWQGIDSDWR